ncbi:hypothetical protein AC623_20370 [Bacillus sp. FJAT-27231]|uniref:bifunctional lytic transglycosylase/C40 family peptidase n=1 Tax=Bacillus sp. FJAT-27231 TaxID=1679168 RepID=UPI000670D8B9|nr:bifunctional lytic transglycosylase/C40 family peptidase [Bacillus sp. FJAT-27231]KMY52500.1 hypothetical protein AC623_20370 [Bacillus sp. FJAT-27231]
MDIALKLLPKKWLFIGGVITLFFFIILLIGVITTLVGGFESSSNDTSYISEGDFVGGTANVSPQVMQHLPLVEEYAKKYGIEQYVAIMLALIQQESGGRGNDPMQSSESFCGRVGCITDVETSIDKGVLHFKSVLEKANYDIKLTLQSYNFGGGFIDWIKQRGGTYTLDLAIQFSKEMYAKEKARGRGHLYTCIRQEAKPLGACYGDILYVEAVLKYYNGGVAAIGNGDGTVIQASGAIKKAIEVGMTALGRPYFWGGGRTTASIARKEFDCSSFVWWAYREAGINLGPMGATTETLKHKGRKISPTQMKVGDLIFWDTYKKDGHVAIYIGDGKFLGAQSSNGVSVERVDNTYWKTHFSGHVRRVVE